MNRLTPETATDNGFTTIILANDGSTTNNLGAGMVHALEFKLQDKIQYNLTLTMLPVSS